MKNGIKIINLEASEIIKEINGKEIIKEYKTVLPCSLVTAKLDRMHIKVKDNKSIDFIGVNFNYGYDTEELEQLKNEVHKQKQIIRDINKKVKIAKKNSDLDEEEKILEQLQREKESLNQLEENLKTEKLAWNKDGLREKLYKNGFTLVHKHTRKGHEVEEKVTYKFWFRTPAKSRVGDSLFINEKLYDEIVKWQDMGLMLPSGETKVVEFQAYRSLTASSVEDFIEINTKHLLVVNDLDSYMNTNIVSVEINENGECVAVPRKDKVKNTLFDGMSLLDSSYFSEGHTFYLLRQHMFKSCAFTANVVQFFKDKFGDDYETAQVKDRYGNNVRVKNIRMITTENSMKIEKFAECGCLDKDEIEITSKKQMFSYWKQMVKNDRYIFGICKHNHSSKFGEYQRMSYQMVNTLLINNKQTKELAQYTVDYINNLKENDDAFIKMLEETATEGNNNNMYMDLYKKNELFRESDMYKRFKTETISSLKKRARQGKLFVEGDNLTVCGNPYLLLLHAVGEVPNIDNVVVEDFTDITLPVSKDYISCYTERFNNNEELAAFRNPHNAPNNIALLHNIKHELMQKYFNFGTNVIAVNLVNTELQDLMNGLDEDSDFLLCTNNKIALSGAKEVFRKKDYACIVNNIPKDTRKWINNNSSIAQIDNILAKSKNSIGVTSNLAQLALSYYQQEGTKELRDIVCIMSVLAQVSIDNSKKSYSIDIEKEIDRIKKLECIAKYKGMLPGWVKYIKDVKASRLLQAEQCNCTMQYLQYAIDNVKNINNNKENLDTVQLLQDIKTNGNTNYEQIKKVEELIGKYDKKVKHTKQLASEKKWKEDKIEEVVKDVRDSIISRIGNMKLTKETMFYLVNGAVKEAVLDNKEKQSDIKKYNRKMLNVLYNTHKELFLSVWA